MSGIWGGTVRASKVFTVPHERKSPNQWDESRATKVIQASKYATGTTAHEATIGKNISLGPSPDRKAVRPRDP
jgi:hypothetical protein